MAWETNGVVISRLSSGDMSGYQYAPVAFSTTNSADGVIVATSAGVAHGIWMDNSTAQTHGRVVVTGVTKALCGATSAMDGAIAVGTRLTVCGKGSLVGKMAGDSIEGTMKLADHNASVLRDVKFTAKKK